MRYEIIRGEDDKYAIFDENRRMITLDWYDSVSSDGLIRGQSIYYIARKDGKEAIFDVYGHQISEWFDRINPNGLISGKSDYYIAKKNGKQAIFDISGKRITKWFNRVFSYGLVRGESDYFIACKGSKCAVYYKDGKRVSDDIPSKHIKGGIYRATFNENIGIVEIKMFGCKPITIEFSPIYPFKEEIIDYTKLLNI